MNNENRTIDEDYLDRLSEILPLQRTLTPLERLLIVIIVSIFVSFVACLLLCLIYPNSSLRKRYSARRRKENQQETYPMSNVATRTNILIVPPPPSYSSIVQNPPNLEQLRLGRKSSNGTVSDCDGLPTSTKNEIFNSLNGKLIRSQSDRSSFSSSGALATISNTFPLAPFVQLDLLVEIDKNLSSLLVHLIKIEQIEAHPAFDDQSEFFVRVQLINAKLFRKAQEASKKRRPTLPLTNWNKQQEKQTKNLLRNKSEPMNFDDKLRFDLNKNDFSSVSLRFLLCSSDRSGLKDILFESNLPLNSSMIPSHQQILEFKEIPQVVFAEIYLGLGYLPTAERFTLTMTKLRHFCKFDKENKFDGRLIVTGFHNGRRFFQKKILCSFDNTASNEVQLNENVTQNIPLHDIPSVHVHLNLIGKDDQSLFPPMSILLGRQTQHETEWNKLTEQARQTHLGWFPFLG